MNTERIQFPDSEKKQPVPGCSPSGRFRLRHVRFLSCFLVFLVFWQMYLFETAWAGSRDLTVSSPELIFETGDKNFSLNRSPGIRTCTPQKRQRIFASSLTVAEGTKTHLKAFANTSMSYESSRPEIANINRRGVITAFKPGKTRIIIRASQTSVYQKAARMITVTVLSTKKAAKLRLKEEYRKVWMTRPGGSGSWSVGITDPSQNVFFGGPVRKMQAASLIKLYIMGAIYEDFSKLSSLYGAGTINALLSPMIRVSSNDAANQLVRLLGRGSTAAGMKRVNQYCKDHEYTDTSMGRLLLQSRAYGDNYTSVKDCCSFLTLIYLSAAGRAAKEDSLPHAKEMLNLLLGQTRRNKIPAGLPAGISAANKTGELYNVENDAAILINSKARTALILVFMSENVAYSPGACSWIAGASGRICRDLLL